MTNMEIVGFKLNENYGSAQAQQLHQLHVVLHKLMQCQGNRCLLLDLQKTRHVGAAFLNQLVAVHKALQENGGQLLLCNVVPELRELFRVTRLDEFLHLCHTREQTLFNLSLTEDSRQRRTVSSGR